MRSSSPNIIRMPKSRKIRWAKKVESAGENKNAYRFLVGKSEGKRPLARPRCRYENNTKMEVTKVGWGGINLIHLVQDRDQRRAIVNTVINLRVPKMFGNS
jgi:hypothetical protein